MKEKFHTKCRIAKRKNDRVGKFTSLSVQLLSVAIVDITMSNVKEKLRKFGNVSPYRYKNVFCVF